MKLRHLLLLTAIAAGFAGCAVYAPEAGTPKRVSADYDAIGETYGVKAFVYGKRTVLEFPAVPSWLSIRDSNGVPVEFESEGRYVRLAHQLDRFSIWSYGRAVTFTVVKVEKPTPTEPPSAPHAQATAAGAIVSQPFVATRWTAPSPPTVDALMHLASQQLDELRRGLKAGNLDAREGRALAAKLDRLEAKLAESAAVIQVQFEFGKADFKPSAEVAGVLVEAARLADLVNVRGRTDSKVAGPHDAELARSRAVAARDFLVEKGVDAKKIKVYSLAAGDRIAPSDTAEGRAANRRVEIELVGATSKPTKPAAIPLAMVTR
ncbi:OmpA family protein (plasmid) [Sphaerotilaceae bacterium SBD11-9]